jgi:hypothetical protein
LKWSIDVAELQEVNWGTGGERPEIRERREIHDWDDNPRNKDQEKI